VIILDPNNTNTTSGGVNPLTGEPATVQGPTASVPTDPIAPQVDPATMGTPVEPVAPSMPASMPAPVEIPAAPVVTPPAVEPVAVPTMPADPMGTTTTEPTTTGDSPGGLPPVQQS
jgi:hypothetical protein